MHKHWFCGIDIYIYSKTSANHHLKIKTTLIQPLGGLNREVLLYRLILLNFVNLEGS